MQSSPSKILPFRPSQLPRQLPSQPDRQSSAEGFFDAHPIGNMVRILCFSSLLWALLGVTIYAVFKMVAGGH